MEFKKSIKLEISDYTAFNIFTLKKVYIMLPLLSICIAYLVIYRDNPEMGLTGFAVYAVVTTVLLVLVFYALIQRALKKSFKTNKAMQSAQEVTLDSIGVHAIGEYGTTNMPWEDMHRVIESKNAFYVYLLKAQALIIPKRLTSADENAVIRTIVKSYLAPNKYKIGEQ